MDLTISFQEIEGAQETWEIIWNIQGKDPDEISQDEDSDEELLPDPESSKLSGIHNILQVLDLTRKQKVIENVLKDDEDFLKKLKICFEKVNHFWITQFY